MKCGPSNTSNIVVMSMPVHLCLSSIPVVLCVIQHLMKSSTIGTCVEVIEERKNLLTILASSTTNSVPEHACALKNRYEITLERSELLCMNNCMSRVLNKLSAKTKSTLLIQHPVTSIEMFLETKKSAFSHLCEAS